MPDNHRGSFYSASNKKPARLSRIDIQRRSSHSEPQLQHTEENTWAVSYADFLMVLLSFFIIFFSQSEEKDSIIMKIKNELAKNNGAGETTLSSQAPVDAASKFNRETLTKELQLTFKDYKFADNESAQYMSVALPENIFDAGKYKFSQKAKNDFLLLAKKLFPFKSQIALTITGHSDATGIIKGKHPKFDDNIELSSLRAYYAARELIAMGFAEDNIRIKTLISDTRNTRSLSLIVTPSHGPSN